MQRGRGEGGKIIGEFIATGHIPTFFAEIETNRLPFTREKFVAPGWYAELIAQGKAEAA